jgi:rhodanese-related sulfurtransferase
MIFALFFLILDFLSIYLLLTLTTPFKYLLLWIIINLSIMSIAYALNRPYYILGKVKSGHINPILLFLNLPWLLFSWSIFRVQMWVSRKDIVNQIEGSSIYISSRPLDNFDYTPYEVVIDLTAEFLKDDVVNAEYICYPNLDAIALTNYYENPMDFKDKKVLVHCANGHGRSSLFVAKLLVDLDIVVSLEEGLALIKKSRPLAVPSRRQL